MIEENPHGEVMRDVACTVCGCVCDDLEVQVRGERLVAIAPDCPLAEARLVGLDAASGDSAFIRESPVAFDEAVRSAVDLVQKARSPLIYGLSRSSTPGQRAAVRLADSIRATIDTTASTCHAPSVMALQQVGESTSSLGEVKNRSDLIVYWGTNPKVSHPRHIERFVDSTGEFISNGRSDRQVIVVDAKHTETARQADLFLHVRKGEDFELIWALRSLIAGTVPEIDAVAGLPIEEVVQLADLLKGHRHVAVFFGLGLTHGASPHANVEALLRLTTELNRHTRCVVRRMRIPGDVAGADSVLCWQTGFPFSVSLARGYPRYNPGEYSANQLLERQEVDTVIMVGSEGIDKLSAPAIACLQQIPLIVLDNPGAVCAVSPNIRFTTAVYGIHRKGTAYRMDETPIPLRPVMNSSLPADHEILAQIESEILAEQSLKLPG